jgi:hypothetical protein
MTKNLEQDVLLEAEKAMTMVNQVKKFDDIFKAKIKAHIIDLIQSETDIEWQMCWYFEDEKNSGRKTCGILYKNIDGSKKSFISY